MERKNKLLISSAFAAVALGFCSPLHAANLPMNTARMQALDKVTGQMSVIDVPVNGEVKFESFSIVVRSCQATPPEETPENYAFVDVADTNREGKVFNIFKGWMVSSSPSLNSVEHPIYDVWLLKCINTDGAEKKALSAEKLAERDKLEKLKEEDVSKEAKLAKEVQAQQAEQEQVAKAEQEEKEKQEKEADEEKARQQALEDEIETSQELGVVVESENNDEGPVSLLNFNQENVPDTSAPVEEKGLLAEPVEEQSFSIEKAPALTDTGVDGLVIIEDTHHETLQDLDLPQESVEIKE